MSKWRIDLENVGRGKVTRSVEVTADTLPDVEHRAVKECSKHLMSRGVEVEKLGDGIDLNYTVLAGFRPVGKVKITTTG
jgi:hypothetical protein